MKMWVRGLYRALWWLLFPLLLVRLGWRGRKEPAYRQHWRERFGFYTQSVPSMRPVCWLHCVSVGETRAAKPLIEALLQNYPQYSLLITHTTPTGRATSHALFDAQVTQVYLPYEYQSGIRRFLRHFRPSVGLVLETECWPLLFSEAQRINLPVFLINARLSARSAKGYARWPSVIQPTLASLRQVLAQTVADAQRLTFLGARHVSVMGNLKYDFTPPETLLQLGSAWRTAWGKRPVVLFASSREGEEALLLAAWQAQPRQALLVLVPRHPQRFDEVANLLHTQGFRYQRRSVGAALKPETTVILGDSMGELFAYYAAADVALLGGSFLPFGGQNLIEACAVGTPIIFGAHTFNFTQAASLAESAGAGIAVADMPTAVAQAEALLQEPSRRLAMREAGLAFTRGQQGASERVLATLAPYLSMPLPMPEPLLDKVLVGKQGQHPRDD